MKEWLSNRGPLVTVFSVYSDFFYYQSGVYTHIAGDYVGGHCVCCVGYNDAQGCWICKNSWGGNWGEAGFFRIAYGECGIDSTMTAVDSVIGWYWFDHGMPANVTVSSSVGAIPVQDTPTASQRPYVFVVGSDGKLWLRWWDGNNWYWSDHGTPESKSVTRGLGAITVKDTPRSFTTALCICYR